MGIEHVAEALQRAEEMFDTVGQDQLATFAGHPDGRQRLLALALMRSQIARGASAIDYLPLARPLVEDSDNDCRWQALIVIGGSIATHPEEVWGVVRAHGSSADSDLRGAVATVLLEHLLEEHFDEYFPRVRAEVLGGSANFAETVRVCWFDRCEGPRYRRVQKLLRSAARGRSKRR